MNNLVQLFSEPTTSAWYLLIVASFAGGILASVSYDVSDVLFSSTAFVTYYETSVLTISVEIEQEKIAKTDGERVILTFDGEKPFLLVEETTTIEEEFSIIPTYGEPYLLIDTVAALTDNSITWNSNGIDYYIVSDVMSQDELIEIARSVNIIPTMK